MESSIATTASKGRDRSKQGRSGVGGGKHHKEPLSKNSLRHHVPHTNNDKSHDFAVVAHKLPLSLTNGHHHQHHSEFFPHPHHYPLPPAPMGPGSPGIVPGSPMISSPTHCSPLHLHPPPISTYPMTLPPHSAIASCTADPSSPMQVVCSPSHTLMSRLQNGGSSNIFHQINGTNPHFSSEHNSTHHIPAGMLPAIPTLQSTATFIPGLPPTIHAPYNLSSNAPPASVTGGSSNFREYPHLLTGIHAPPLLVGSDFSNPYHLTLQCNNDPTHTPNQQFH